VGRRRAKVPRPEQVSLDVLLTESSEAADWTEEEPSHVRWLVNDVLISLLAGAAVYAVMLVVGLVTPYPVLVLVLLAVRLLRRALMAVPIPPMPPAFYSAVWGVVDDTGARFAPMDGVVRSVERWEARFGWTERDPSRYRSAVQPRLYELVDERLRQRHGITLRSDPARARELIGEELWTFLHARMARTPSAREMAAVAGEMEKI
jgi:hypothetical protein